MIHLDQGDHRPLYEQIKDKLKNLIINGILRENEKIPSVRELATSLAINPNTIQKAYKDLESEGYIYSQKAKGSFVCPRHTAATDRDISSLTDSLRDMVTELRFLEVEKEEITEIIEEIYKEAAHD